jgi:hypothetical protein
MCFDTVQKNCQAPHVLPVPQSREPVQIGEAAEKSSSLLSAVATSCALDALITWEVDSETDTGRRLSNSSTPTRSFRFRRPERHRNPQTSAQVSVAIPALYADFKCNQGPPARNPSV